MSTRRISGNTVHREKFSQSRSVLAEYCTVNAVRQSQRVSSRIVALNGSRFLYALTIARLLWENQMKSNRLGKRTRKTSSRLGMLSLLRRTMGCFRDKKEESFLFTVPFPFPEAYGYANQTRTYSWTFTKGEIQEGLVPIGFDWVWTLQTSVHAHDEACWHRCVRARVLMYSLCSSVLADEGF